MARFFTGIADWRGALEAGVQARACAMQIMWKIRKIGTRKVGIRLRGRIVMGAMEMPCGFRSGAVAPMLTAVTKSVMPSTCHAMKLARLVGLASFHATKDAVAPMKMSPYPAERANMAGRTPRASRMRNVIPMIRKD